jgi:hypothetical protein
MDIQTIKFMPSLQVKYEASGKSSILLAKTILAGYNYIVKFLSTL